MLRNLTLENRVYRFAILFFLSGGAGLVYEVVWTRVLGDVVGSTALASSAVFSVFLAGLAVGAWWFGRRGRQGGAALRLYGILELGVGLLGGTASVVLFAQRDALAALGPHGPGVGAELAFAVGLSVVFIGVPAFLMGGTLPVLIQAASSAGDARRVAPLLYGWNTLGAAVGALTAGFLLIWSLGFRGTIGVAVAVNVLVGLIALRWAGKGWGAPDPRESGAGCGSELERGTTLLSDSGSSVDPEMADASGDAGETGTDRGWRILALASGFQILALEVMWGRVSRFILGDRTMALTALLFVFVASLGLASLLAPAAGRWLRADSRPRVLLALAMVLLFGGLLNMVAIPAGASLVSQGGLFALSSRGILQRLLIVAMLIGPSTLVLGLVFPLLIWSSRDVEKSPGRVVGRLYLANTVGAVGGAWVAAFVLSGWLGTLGGLKLLTGLGLLAAAGLFATVGRGRARVAGTAVAGVAALATVILPGTLVTVLSDETLISTAEDEYGVQVMVLTDRGTIRVRNNRLSLIFELGDPATDHAQQMAAHWPMLLARNPERVLNIGTGYGITAGAFTLYPGVKSIETIEILPFLVANLNEFRAHNFGFISDPRVTVHTGDGRTLLSSGSESYDVLSVNVLDPYLPGSASLYTTDFWEIARDHLSPGGAYTQLFWGDDVDLLVRGLNRVFPTVLYFPAYGNTSYIVVAFAEKFTADELSLHLERLGVRAASEIERLEGGPPSAVLPGLLTNGWSLARELDARSERTSGPLHTDDLPLLEYRWAHGVPGVSVFDSPLVVY